MSMIHILKIKEFNYDITVYQNGKPARKAWADNKQNAYGKAQILAEYYTDDNGQCAAICYNEC